jgi:murein DD-endopeptidase MepM/ murein hydrolase activator NlpD
MVALLTCAVAPARAASGRVAALQVGLTGVGLYGAKIDGISGPLTERALRRFQRRRHIAIDGIAGPRTRRALGRRGRPRLGSRPMRRRRRGWDVAALQFLLAKRGFPSGSIDGGFGPATAAAVRRFQRAVGLAVDGVAGPRTLRALRRRTVHRRHGGPGGPVRFLRPVPGSIGDGFGFVSGRRHTGLDFPRGMGSPVGAAGVGRVAFAGWNSGGYGNLVVVRHRLGYETWYAHMSRVAVSVGQAVSGGTRIGYVGSTGRSTGPHLHFEARRYGTPIDPLPRLLSTVAARAARTPAPGARTPAPTAGIVARRPGRRLNCRPNADTYGTRDADPRFARPGRCP